MGNPSIHVYGDPTSSNGKNIFQNIKRNIEVLRPSTVTTYNKFITGGGVDLLDGLVSYYRIEIRSRKYNMKLIYHFIDMAVVSGWLLYRRDCRNQGCQTRDK